LKHGPQVRQCWTGIEGVGEQSPGCPPGMECGFMPSCVAYPAITPVMPNGSQFSGIGGPTSNTCHLSHRGKHCNQDLRPYLREGKQVGYQCGPDGQVTCCVQDMEADNIIYPTVEDVAKHTNCPGAIEMTSCPTCPPPTSEVDTCKINNHHRQNFQPCNVPRPHGMRPGQCPPGCQLENAHSNKCVMIPGRGQGKQCNSHTECGPGLTCAMLPGDNGGRCEPYSHM
jgi:hypothetical protein